MSTVITSALIEFVQRLLDEPEPSALLRNVCQTARQLTGARVVLVGMKSEATGQIEHVVSDAPSPPTGSLPALEEAVQGRVDMRQAVRAIYRGANGGDSWPMLVAPIATRQRVYGWLALIDKPSSAGQGSGGFTGADEYTVTALAAFGGTAYENAILLARESEMEFALSVAHVGLSFRDVGADHLEVSRSLAELLGLPPGTRSISRPDFLARVHPEDAARVDATVREAARKGTEFNLEYRLYAGERGWRWFRSNGRVRINEQGRERIFSGITDVTERRSLESQLQQAQKMEALGQLAGGVAHDFNNFLTAILGYAQFLLDTVPESAQRRDAAEIVKTAERAASLTKQLLAFGRRQVTETEVVDVNARVADMTDMLRRIIGVDVRLTTALRAEKPAVTLGHGQLEQILMNLVVNARDAIDGAGRIHVDTSDVVSDRPLAAHATEMATGRYVEIAVSDTGCGMDEETKERLFEPFFTTKPRTQGSGLGLATVYGIVTQYGGSIAVTSEPGRGSTFRIRLPRHEQPALAPLAESPAVVTRGAETVLLAEDEPSVRRLARRILERAGYRVIEAANLAEAEAAAASLDEVDLLLTDVIMPGGTGPDLFRRLSSRKPGLRVLFMSGYAERDLFDRNTISTTDAFLAKPFSADALVAKVRNILDR